MATYHSQNVSSFNEELHSECKIQDYEEQIALLQLERTSRENITLLRDRECQNLERQLMMMQQRLAESERVVKTFTRDLDQKNREISLLKQSLNEKDLEVSALKIKYQKREKQLSNQLEDTKINLILKIDAGEKLREEVQDLKEEIEMSNSKGNDEQELCRLRARCEELEDDSAIVELERASHLRVLESQTQELGHLKKELEHAQEKIKSFEEISTAPLRIRRKIMSGSYENSSVEDEDNLPAVIRYAWKGKIDKLRNYLRYSTNQSNINKQDELKRTALHMAASWADDKMLRVLLSVPGINVNLMDCDGKTALRKAVEMNSLPCVKLLLEHRADPVLVAKDHIDSAVKNSSCYELLQKALHCLPCTA